MPFCRHCGSRTETGQKFCEECGAPIVAIQPAPFASPSEQPGPEHPPGTPGDGTPGVPVPGPEATAPHRKEQPAVAARSSAGKILIAVLVFAIVLGAAAWYIGMPLLHGNGVPGTGFSAVTTAPTTHPAVTPDTPRMTTPATTVPPTPTPIMTVEDRYSETYEVIYTSNRSYQYGEKVTFPYALIEPPLYVKFNVTPAMVNDTKIADIGLSSEHVVYAVYPDPHAWFEVQVLDAANGAVIESRGFGVSKGYSDQERQEFMVRKSGDYIVEISGSMVSVITEIRKGTT